MDKHLKNRAMFLVISLFLITSLLVGCAAPATQAPVTQAPAAATQAPASSGQSASGQTVRVAFVGPLTGPGAADLILASKGAQLAVDQRNAAGGICKGRQVKMELYDDKADPKEAANVATKLTADNGILAVAHGWNSSAVLAAAPIFNEAGLVQMDYYGVAPKIHDAGPYTFRVIPTGELMARFLADWMVNSEGFKKVASVYENTDYGKGLFDVYAAAVKEFGGEVVASEAVLMDQKDFSAILSKFKAAAPGAVAMFGQYEAAAFWAKQAPDVGFSAPLFGSDGIFAPELIKLGGAAVEGVRSMSAYTIDSPDAYVANFVKSFRTSFGTDPNNGAGYAHDAMLLMLDGLDGGGCTRDGAKTWLTTNVKDIQGVTGKITLKDRDRNFQEGLYVKLVVKNGAFVPYTK